jgi:adenylate cyclase, class 1
MTACTPPTVAPPEPPELGTIRKRFQALNAARLERVREALRPRQRAFLDLLPLLLHVNHPLLPGYVSGATPAGLCNYSPERETIEAARRLARSFSYQQRAPRAYRLHALYLMGSGGTVAHSEASDCDLWLCHEPALSEPERELLRAKTDAISRWAASLELETHFYLMDAEAFRNGRHEALSHDNSGSCQHYLLLEEFYRTGLLLAGRPPLWWLVPPEREADYEACASELLGKRFVKADEAIDFGPVRLPPGEFVGAALWQLYKGIDSPYKSVLKILLMEAYADEYPAMDLLSSRFKRAVYAGETVLERLDPYVMMAQKVEQYLVRRGERDRLELARRCFYFKVGEALTLQQPPGRPVWRRVLLAALVRAWGWDPARLVLLDARPTWKIPRVLEERRLLVEELTRSYRLLSTFAREHGREHPINASDLNRLGRKLYAAFERKAGKIELINPGISNELTEAHLSVHEAPIGGADGEAWLLYRGEVRPGDGSAAPLKRSGSVIELLAWAHFNRVTGPGTAMSLHTARSGLTVRELGAIGECLRQVFPCLGPTEVPMEALERPARVLAATLFVNVGLDPQSHLTYQGVQLLTERTDALRFGARLNNLALTFDLVVATSWQETLTFRYAGADALAECLCAYLKWAAPGAGAEQPLPHVRCHASARGEAIARRVTELFADVLHWYQEEAGACGRYVFDVEQHHYLLQVVDGTPACRRAGSHDALLKLLGEAQRSFSPVHIDRVALLETPLPLLFAENRAGLVQFYYHVRAESVSVYVVDEKGSLFHQVHAFHDSAALLNQFQRFFDTVLPRRDYLLAEPPTLAAGEAVEFNEVVRDERGGWLTLPRQAAREGRPGGYFNVQVIGETTAGRTMLSVYCDDREFSSLEHGENLFPAVAQFVLQRRASGERYPIYITDFDLSPTALAAEAKGAVQTVHFLQYKKRVEDLLNRALLGS